MAIQFLPAGTRFELAEGRIPELRWRSGVDFTASLTTRADWSALRVRLASGAVLPVAYDSGSDRPFTNPDWQILLDLSSPKASFRALEKSFSTIDPLTAYPHASGVCGGNPAVAALVARRVLPLPLTIRLLSLVSTRVPLEEVRGQATRTLADMALSRGDHQGLLLALWLRTRGVPCTRSNPRATPMLAWDVLQALVSANSPKSERLDTIMATPFFRTFLASAPLGPFHDEASLRSALVLSSWESLGARDVMDQDILLVSRDDVNRVFYRGPLAGALLHWLRTRSTVSVAHVSLVMDLVTSSAPLDLSRSITWNAQPSSMDELIMPLPRGQAARSDAMDWPGFCAAVRARALEASLPSAGHQPARARL